MKGEGWIIVYQQLSFKDKAVTKAQPDLSSIFAKKVLLPVALFVTTWRASPACFNRVGEGGFGL